MPAPSAASKKKATAERELVIKRTLDAPLDLVWEVWADPEHAKQWWGPKDFTVPVVELDARSVLLSESDGKGFEARDHRLGDALGRGR